MHGIVDYTFLDVCEKIHQFRSNIKKDAHRRKLVSFFCITVYKHGRLLPCLMLHWRALCVFVGFGFVTYESEEIVNKVCEIHFHEINNKMVLHHVLARVVLMLYSFRFI